MSTQFPKKISENGWYELSNGETVRGEEAAREAEERLAEDTVLDEMEDAEREDEDSKGPLAGNFEEDEEDDDLEGKVCVNCGAPATFVDDPPTARKAYFCTVHRPVYLR